MWDSSGKIKTFAIISPENPLGWKHSDDKEFMAKYQQWTKDKKLFNKLQKEILKGGIDSHYVIKSTADKIEQNGLKALKFGAFNYVPIKGSYGEKENSFIIFNLSKADAEIIARSFGQESFFFEHCYTDKPSNIAYYKTTNACQTYKLIEISDTITDEESAEDFFSKFGFKYRINMIEFGDKVTPVVNNGEFEESMNEESTFSIRAKHRREAYRPEK